MVELGVPTASFGKIPEGGAPSFPGVSKKLGDKDQLQLWRDRLRKEALSRQTSMLLENSMRRRGVASSVLDASKGRGMDMMPGYSSINTVYDHSGFYYDVGTGRWRPPTDDELEEQERKEKQERRERRRRLRQGGSKLVATPPRSSSESALSSVWPRPANAESRPGSAGCSQLSVVNSSLLSSSLPPVRSSQACSRPPILGSGSNLPWQEVP